MTTFLIEFTNILDRCNTLDNVNQGELVTDTSVEAGTSIGLAVNIGTDQLYSIGTPASVDLTDALVYVYTSNTAIQNSWKEATLADSAHGLWLSDGTNSIVCLNAGGDRRVFSHNDGPVSWQCFLIDTKYLDTKDSNGEIYEAAGSLANLDLTTITQVGAYFVTNSKALGGGFNCFIDNMRYIPGNRRGEGFALRNDNGDSVGFATLLGAVLEDRSTAVNRGSGFIREYAPGVYGIQAPITLATNSSSIEGRFRDSNFTLIFEDRDVAEDAYKITFSGSGNPITDPVTVEISNSIITTARPAVSVESGPNLALLDLNTVTFNALKNDINFPTDTDGVDRIHNVTDCTFNGCGQISPGTVDFTGCTISNATSGATGAVLLDGNGTDSWSDLTFITTDSLGHGIYITASGTYQFDNFLFEGFGADGTTDAALFNDSAGDVVINVVDGNTPTFRNGTSATTTVNNNVSVTLTGLVNPTEIRVYNAGTTTELDGQEDVTTGSFAFSLQGGIFVDIVIFAIAYEPERLENFEVPAVATSIPISQRFDRNYRNP